MKKVKTFMVEVNSNKSSATTLVYLSENEYGELEKKSLETEEYIGDIFAKEYIDNHLGFKYKDELKYIKDYSLISKYKVKYFLMNIKNFSTMSVYIVGPIDGRVNNTREFMSKI